MVPVCEEYGDVVLESFQQLEEGKINTPQLTEKVEELFVNHEDFTLIDRKNKRMISIRNK